jgi:hypothetical protein
MEILRFSMPFAMTCENASSTAVLRGCVHYEQ